MENLIKVSNIREMFLQRYLNNDFVYTKDQKMVEIINASFVADEDFIFGTPNKEWQNAELDWYLSESDNVNDIKYVRIPKAWKNSADKDGNINSNYGRIVFSKDMHDKMVNQLKKDKGTRQAVSVYMPEDIYEKAFENGKNDFICTWGTQVLIRERKLFYIVNMRSSDAVLGYKNDWHWHDFICGMIKRQLSMITDHVILWNSGSLHIYEKHFHFLEAMSDGGIKYLEERIDEK